MVYEQAPMTRVLAGAQAHALLDAAYRGDAALKREAHEAIDFAARAKCPILLSQNGGYLRIWRGGSREIDSKSICAVDAKAADAWMYEHGWRLRDANG